MTESQMDAMRPWQKVETRELLARTLLADNGWGHQFTEQGNVGRNVPRRCVFFGNPGQVDLFPGSDCFVGTDGHGRAVALSIEKDLGAFLARNGG